MRMFSASLPSKISSTIAPDRAALARLLDKAVAVEIFTAQRDKKIARIQGSRVGAHPRNDLGRITLNQLPTASSATLESESGSMIRIPADGPPRLSEPPGCRRTGTV